MAADDKVAKILDTSASRPMIPNRTLDPRTNGFLKESVHTTVNAIEKNANIDVSGRQMAKVCYELSSDASEGSFLDWAGSFLGIDSPDLTSVMAYVPMVHSGIPDPWIIAEHRDIVINQADPDWRALVDTLLPDSSAKITVASSTDTKVGDLAPGTWIWIEYVDSVNDTNGVLLEVASPALLGDSPSSTRTAHASDLPVDLTGPPGALDTVLETFQSRSTTITLLKGGPFTENRVRRNTFGALPSNSPLLVPIPSVGTTRKVHTLVAKRLAVMNRAWVAANPSKPPFKAASGWRRHKWRNYKQYVDAMSAPPPRGYGSLREGSKWVAYASPHETGLAIDFGNNGLTPKKAQISRMLGEPAYRWLQQNAYKYGFSPYKNEPWHWEVQMPRDNWNSGDEFTSDLSVYIEEKSNETQRLTRNVIFAREAFA